MSDLVRQRFGSELSVETLYSDLNFGAPLRQEHYGGKQLYSSHLLAVRQIIHLQVFGGIHLCYEREFPEPSVCVFCVMLSSELH